MKWQCGLMACSTMAAILLAAPAVTAAQTSAPITTDAQITVKGPDGKVIPLKPAEKVALMFLDAISSMEDDCSDQLKRRCSLAELAVGVKAHDSSIGKLRYDPARDKNYKYTVTIKGQDWQASAIPQHAGLGGFYEKESGGFIPDTYYKANGEATAQDKELTGITIAGEPFQAH